MTRSLAVVGFLTVSFLGYETYSRWAQDARLQEERLKTEIERQRAEKYKAQLQSVLAERKTTRFRVLKTEPPTADGKTPRRYTLRVSQFNDKAEKVFSRDIEVAGNKIYFEGVVIHFRTELNTEGKENVHLLTRVFSDILSPSQGITLLDEQIKAADKLVQGEPETSAVNLDQRASVQKYVRRIAEDPEFANAEGVRTVNGEAVCDYQDLSESYVYTLVEKANGGYLIEKAPIP